MQYLFIWKSDIDFIRIFWYIYYSLLALVCLRAYIRIRIRIRLRAVTLMDVSILSFEESYTPVAMVYNRIATRIRMPYVYALGLPCIRIRARAPFTRT